MGRRRREVDWVEIERMMRDSFTGRARPEHDPDWFRKSTAALKADPERYKALHAKVKGEEIAKLRSF